MILGDLHFLETSTRVWVKIRCPKNWMVTRKDQNLCFGCRISPGMFFPLPRIFFSWSVLFSVPCIYPSTSLPCCMLFAAFWSWNPCLLACWLAHQSARTWPGKKNGEGEKKRKNMVPVVCWALSFDQFTYQTNSTQVHPLDAGENICHFTWIHYMMEWSLK